MKLPSAAQKRCLLQAVEPPHGQVASIDQTALVSQALGIVHGVCTAPGCSASAGLDSRGGSSMRAGRVSSAAAWADLLIDLIRRGRDAVDRALAASHDAVSEAGQQVIELSWAVLDALAAVRSAWKSDTFLAVRSRRNQRAMLFPSPPEQHALTHIQSLECM